jgi:hypothetical protein
MKGLLKMTKVLEIISCAILLLSPAFAANPALLKKDSQAYHNTGLYEKDLTQVIAQARDYIIKEATANRRSGHLKKLAIVLDIDETSLNHDHKVVERGFATDSAQLHKEALTASAPAMVSMLSLYQGALKCGVQVFFVTGRPLSELKAIRTNLLRAGFRQWAGLYLRPDNYHQPSTTSFKVKARKLITEQGYTIIASISDQDSVLKGGFMQKGFKLPNPFYHLP